MQLTIRSIEPSEFVLPHKQGRNLGNFLLHEISLTIGIVMLSDQESMIAYIYTISTLYETTRNYMQGH